MFLSSALHACLARNDCISSEELFSIPQCPVTAPRKLGQGPAPWSKCRVVKRQQKQVLLQGISKAGRKQDVKVGHNKGTGQSVTSLCRLLGSCWSFLSSLGSIRAGEHTQGIPGDQSKLTDLKIDQKVTADEKKCQWVQGWMQCKVSSGLTRWAELAGEEFGRWKYETRGMPGLLLWASQ